MLNFRDFFISISVRLTSKSSAEQDCGFREFRGYDGRPRRGLEPQKTRSMRRTTTGNCHAEPRSSRRTDWTADRPESGPIVCGAGTLPAVLNSYRAGPRRTPIAAFMSQLCKSQRIVVKPRISRISQLSRIKELPLAYICVISVIRSYSARVPDIRLCNECKCAWIVFVTRSYQKPHHSIRFFYRKLDVSLIAM